jgi:excinuclease ABC subunit A
MYEIIHKNLQARLERKYRSAKNIQLRNFFRRGIFITSNTIDQSPIGRTPRSNVATYTRSFTHIRDMFASTEEARIRGWKQNMFSFNVKVTM